MKMRKVEHEIKCDFYGCKNLAKYAFSTKGFVRRDLVFCEQCMRQMFECFSGELVPAAVEAPYKNDVSTKKRKNKQN